MGRPPPTDVLQYPALNEVAVWISVPPAGHRYARVADDILLIAIGSMLFVDAIENLMHYWLFGTRQLHEGHFYRLFAGISYLKCPPSSAPRNSK